MATKEQTKELVKKSQIVTVYDFMEQKKDLISKALPPHIGADRLVAMFTIVIKSNPEIASCTQASLIGALVQTAQLGLMPGNVSHCYYVPFNNKKKDGKYQREVQFILGYKGMVELVNRSREAAILSTEVVYANDQFEYELGLSPVLKHIPVWDERGEVRGVYCVAKNLLANEKLFVYLTKEDIDKVRNASKAGSSDYSPWAKWYEEMAKKTAIKRICKLLPLAIDVQKKIGTDETIKSDIQPDMTEVQDDTNWNDEKAKAEDAQISDEETGKPDAEEMAEADRRLAE
jgi:recombination protein RecT